MKPIGYLIIASLLALALRANASDGPSTEAMLAMCKSNGEGYGYCLGFVTGAALLMEQVGLGTSGQFRGAFGMCVSSPYPTGNAEVAAFINWAERNPQERAMPSANGVMTALSEAWRCAEQR
jgi:hypothetical protein